jgi:uncharacterized protein (DUF433 family)
MCHVVLLCRTISAEPTAGTEEAAVARSRAKPKEHKSFRFDTRVLEALSQHAREAGVAESALAQRYLDEGLRRDEHPLITFREGMGGRRAVLVGTRLDVWQVIESVKHSGAIPEAADYLSIPPSWVTACVRYYADYKDEVDEWRQLMQAVADREEDAWRRTQAILA